MNTAANHRKRSIKEERLEFIYLEIRSRICMLDFPPGSRINEAELAQEFGVSRTPVRRALTRLETEGLIETQHGNGTFVTTLPSDFLAEVYELRIELSPLIGRLQPRQPTAENTQRLRETLASIDALMDKPDLRRLAQLNIDYYLEMTTLVGNRALKETLERLFFLTTRIWLMKVPNLDWNEVVQATREEIAMILQAIEADDMQSVGVIAQLNIKRTMNRYMHASEQQANQQ
ncbi:GntR family transcriptional regulator [Halomonas huangheensis]|uniref:HTH gntR-type domain-containing protein n=1 Tax=Halomonas huangheensis TaxID=1178482 RepID=W1N768_9GAMM|nr:GntR family transcriptional regulator [Halomonas huangheensis]ALM50888.1 hypothetical protein AR456_00190 [Halomonas huangheensis]ERL51031.1 hypothetical protein BJB45_20785 [Halomonas huangheensis]